MDRQVDTKTNHNSIVASFKQNASQFGTVRQNIVGPFDLNAAIGGKSADHLVERNRRNKCERRHGRIAVLEAH